MHRILRQRISRCQRSNKQTNKQTTNKQQTNKLTYKITYPFLIRYWWSRNDVHQSLVITCWNPNLETVIILQSQSQTPEYEILNLLFDCPSFPGSCYWFVSCDIWRKWCCFSAKWFWLSFNFDHKNTHALNLLARNGWRIRPAVKSWGKSERKILSPFGHRKLKDILRVIRWYWCRLSLLWQRCIALRISKTARHRKLEVALIMTPIYGLI